MKATAVAPSNIAFIKYWGKKDEKLRLPTNNSISMNLSGMFTTTTVEFSNQYKEDLIIINGEVAGGIKKDRVIAHLDRIRKLGNIDYKAKVVSDNNFPTAAGLSSSASGFAALTLAASAASGLKLTERKLSILARQASGSACRSIPSGFVEWLEGKDNETSYARSIYPPSYWKLIDIVVILGDKEKETATTLGQKFAFTSPFFRLRLEKIKDKILSFKKYLKERDFENFGKIVENESLELHAIMMTSTPSLIYWLPETVAFMKLVRVWRNEGLPIYFTINTGYDMHLLCEEKDKEKALQKIQKINTVKEIIINYPSKGAKLIQNHLF